MDFCVKTLITVTDTRSYAYIYIYSSSRLHVISYVLCWCHDVLSNKFARMCSQVVQQKLNYVLLHTEQIIIPDNHTIDFNRPGPVGLSSAWNNITGMALNVYICHKHNDQFYIACNDHRSVSKYRYTQRVITHRCSHNDNNLAIGRIPFGYENAHSARRQQP